MPQSVEAVPFRKVCSRYATGIAVATVVTAAGEPRGITVNSFTSVSLQPPIVLFCVDRRSRHWEFFTDARHFGINVLAEEQRHLSQLFSSRVDDRFHGLEWHTGNHGVPLLNGVLAHLECERHKIVPAGDHAVIFGEVLRADRRDGRPLLYFGGDYRGLDAAPDAHPGLGIR